MEGEGNYESGSCALFLKGAPSHLSTEEIRTFDKCLKCHTLMEGAMWRSHDLLCHAISKSSVKNKK